MNSQGLHILCDGIFLVTLHEKFEIDHSWGVDVGNDDDDDVIDDHDEDEDEDVDDDDCGGGGGGDDDDDDDDDHYYYYYKYMLKFCALPNTFAVSTITQIARGWLTELVDIESAAVSDSNGPLPPAAVTVPVETNFPRHSAVSSQWMASVEPAGRMRTTAQRLGTNFGHLVSGIAGESVPGLRQFVIARVGPVRIVDSAVSCGDVSVDGAFGS